jgi:hypothetical protein
LSTRRGLADLRDRLEARSPGHVQVEHEHVGLVAARRADRGLDVADRRDDLEVRLRAEQQLETAADDGVVVGEHDRDRAGLRVWLVHLP